MARESGPCYSFDDKMSKTVKLLIAGVVGFFILLVLFSGDGEQSKSSAPVSPVFDATTIAGKTVSELRKTFQNPTFDMKPQGEVYGHLSWEKEGITLYLDYLDVNEVPEAFEFQFEGVEVNFAEFEKALQLVGVNLSKNQFKDTSPPAINQYEARNLLNFKVIRVQSSRDNKMRIASIVFIQRCETPSICL